MHWINVRCGTLNLYEVNVKGNLEYEINMKGIL